MLTLVVGYRMSGSSSLCSLGMWHMSSCSSANLIASANSEPSLAAFLSSRRQLWYLRSSDSETLALSKNWETWNCHRRRELWLCRCYGALWQSQATTVALASWPIQFLLAQIDSSYLLWFDFKCECQYIRTWRASLTPIFCCLVDSAFASVFSVRWEAFALTDSETHGIHNVCVPWDLLAVGCCPYCQASPPRWIVRFLFLLLLHAQSGSSSSGN